MFKKALLLALFISTAFVQFSYSETLINLEKSAHLGFGGSYLYGLKIHEGYAYTNSEEGQLIIDVSDPLSPEIVNIYQSKDLQYWYFDIEGNRGLIPVDEYNIHVVDMTDPAYPVPLGVITNQDSLRFRYMKLHGNTAIVSDNENIQFYEISDPVNPEFLTEIIGINGDEYISSFTSFGDYLIVAYNSGCTFINIEDPGNPVIINNLESDADVWYQSILVNGNRMYTYGYDGLRIWNIENIESPEIISFLEIERESLHKAEMNIDENILYVTAAQVSRAINVEDDNNPFVAETYTTGDGQLVKGQDVDGNYLYMSIYTAEPSELVESQLLVFDLNDETNYSLVTDFCQAGYPRNVEVVGDFAYMYEIHSLTTFSIFDNNIEFYDRITNHTYRWYDLDEYNGDLLQYYFAAPDWNLYYTGIRGFSLRFPDAPGQQGGVYWSGSPRGKIYAHDQVHMISGFSIGGVPGNSIINTVDIWDLSNMVVSDTTWLAGPAYGAAYVDNRMIIGSLDTNSNTYKLQALDFDEDFMVTSEVDVTGAAWDIVSQGYYFYAVIYNEDMIGGTIEIYYFDSDDFTHLGTLMSFNNNIENIKIQNTKLLISINEDDEALNYTTHEMKIFNLDNPATPELIASSAGTQTIYDFDFISENTLAVTSTAGLSIYTITNVEVTEKPSIESQPSTMIISEIYPNPFNSSTRIKINVPVGQETEIAVFDILGREISHIFSGNLSEGKYDFNFDGSDLASGIYFLRLKSGQDQIQTKKLLLVN